MFAKPALGLMWLCSCAAFAQSGPQAQFMSLEQARPVLTALHKSLPEKLKAPAELQPSAWQNWMQESDREIRARLERDEEDTLVNLLPFGVTFTREYRIEDEYLVRYGKSSLVNSFAGKRASDLLRTLAAPHPSEGLLRMRVFLEKKGYPLKTAAQRARARKYLLASLGRTRDEFVKYRSQKKDETRFQLFKDRGISLDTNLWPDFLLDEHFRRMARQAQLKPHGIRRVAVVGPGLNFANKEKGNDFYPPQTIQPFSVIDSLMRWGLADPAGIDLFTLDISQDVNLHVARARDYANAGKAYIAQLPWNTAARHDPACRSGFTQYWNRLGDQIGESIPPIAVPAAAAETQTRAIRIRPEIVRRITPVDMNIVFQRLAPDQAFDLTIGTNIFIYYGECEQSLARANVSAMLKSGGFLLTNDKLPDVVASGLQAGEPTVLVVARDPDVTEYLFSYQKTK
jgi:hypothetical protein